jgi:chromosome segregation ATPase
VPESGKINAILRKWRLVTRTLRLGETVAKLSDHVEKTQQAVDRRDEQDRQHIDLLGRGFTAVKDDTQAQTETLLATLQPILGQLETLSTDVAAVKQAVETHQQQDAAVAQRLDQLHSTVTATRQDILHALNSALRTT